MPEANSNCGVRIASAQTTVTVARTSERPPVATSPAATPANPGTVVEQAHGLGAGQQGEEGVPVRVPDRREDRVRAGAAANPLPVRLYCHGHVLETTTWGTHRLEQLPQNAHDGPAGAGRAERLAVHAEQLRRPAAGPPATRRPRESPGSRCPMGWESPRSSGHPCLRRSTPRQPTASRGRPHRSRRGGTCRARRPPACCPRRRWGWCPCRSPGCPRRRAGCTAPRCRARARRGGADPVWTRSAAHRPP